MALLVLVAISGGFQVRLASATFSTKPHVPILIDGNSGLVVGSNGVVSGGGTAQNPYLIEGWSIAAAQGQAAVKIQHTTEFFIVQNILTLGSGGVYLINANHGSVLTSKLNGTVQGVRVEGSQDVTVSGNTVSYGGISVADPDPGPFSTNLVISNNLVIDGGISIFSSHGPAGMRVSGNTILGRNLSYLGIDVYAVGATISGNSVFDTTEGIVVGGSKIGISDNVLETTSTSIRIGANSTTLSGNIMTGAGIRMEAPTPPYDYPSYFDSHSIQANNLVNGEPVLYYSRCAGLKLANKTVGQLIIASCSMVDVSNVTTVGKAGVGLLLAYVSQARLVRSHINDNCDGLMVVESAAVNVSESDFATNRCDALRVLRSTDLTLAHCVVSQSQNGLFVDNSANTTIVSNLFASNNFTGARLDNAVNPVVSQNRVQDNRGDGLTLANFVNGLIERNWISGNLIGISILGGNGLNVTDNTLTYNVAGISFRDFDYTVGTSYVYNTIVYHNNFIYNIEDQADHVPGIVLAWDNGYPSGGNYWSDYIGSDNCSGANQNICGQPDGIGDTLYRGIVEFSLPYHYRSQSPLSDNYPLIKFYGDITQDGKPPEWPNGSTLTLTKVNSSSVSLQWSSATDDTLVSKYLIIKNATVTATVPGNVLAYTVSGLSSGSSYMFRVEAQDPAGLTSTGGPSGVVTLSKSGQNSPNPSNGTNPPSGSPLNPTWWTQNPLWGYLAGVGAAILAGAVVLVRRRICRG